MKLNRVKNKERGVLLSVSGHCGAAKAVTLDCIIVICQVNVK